MVDQPVSPSPKSDPAGYSEADVHRDREIILAEWRGLVVSCPGFPDSEQLAESAARALAAAGRLLPADARVEWAIRLTWHDRDPIFAYHFPDRQAAQRQLDRERGYWRVNSAGRAGPYPDRFEVVWRYRPGPGPWAPVDPPKEQP